MNSQQIILGASGFVGQKLLKSAPSSIGLSSKELDLTAPTAAQALEKHLNSSSSLTILSALTPDRGKDLAAMEKNILMVTNISRALENSGARHVLLVSSDAVYPESESFISETTRTDSTNLYGLGHSVREKILQECCSRKGIPLLILRPSAIYGAGDTHNSYGPNRFVRTAIEKGEITLFGDGSDKRDHLYIDDLVKAIGVGSEKELSGIVNISSGTALAFSAVAEIVKNTMNEQFKREVSINKGAPKPASYRHFDCSKRLKMLPEVPMTEATAGIKKMLSSLLS